MAEQEAWKGFYGRLWKEEINVRDFIQENYTPYDGDQSFLAGPTDATNKLFDKLQELQKAEHNKKSVGLDGKERTGVLDMDTDVVTGLTSHGAGYIDEKLKDLEQVVGLQTDKPLKRAFMPYGGIRMAEQSCEMYGYKPNPEL
ncbi:MAG: formate acetyltransferase, partial [Treponema sp.]|nr:formate acetyltransferase [Treponema sp.]